MVLAERLWYLGFAVHFLVLGLFLMSLCGGGGGVVVDWLDDRWGCAVGEVGIKAGGEGGAFVAVGDVGWYVGEADLSLGGRPGLADLAYLGIEAGSTVSRWAVASSVTSSAVER